MAGDHTPVAGAGESVPFFAVHHARVRSVVNFAGSSSGCRLACGLWPVSPW